MLKYHDIEECSFCNEFVGNDQCNFRRLFPREELETRIVYRSENFVALPGLGTIGDAYLLILPVYHYPNMASLPDVLQPELAEFKQFVITNMKKHYSEPMVFEHGSLLDRTLGAGCCFEHAHFHLVSTSFSLLEDLQSEYVIGKFGFRENVAPKRIREVCDLRNWLNDGIAYLYYESPGGEVWGFPVVQHIPSQFMRRLLAQKLQLSEGIWDWMVYPNKNAIKSQCNEFGW